jgi:hypothetical protein
MPYWDKLKMLAGLCSFWSLLGRICFLAFSSSLEAACIYWFMIPSPIFKVSDVLLNIPPEVSSCTSSF